MWIIRLLGTGIFKSVAFILAVAVIAIVWMYDASILVAGEDLNLAGIKWLATHLPEGYGAKTEAALRMFGADKAFLFTEVVGMVKLLMLVLVSPFRHEHHH